jgi:hypothetical protein
MTNFNDKNNSLDAPIAEAIIFAASALLCVGWLSLLIALAGIITHL